MHFGDIHLEQLQFLESALFESLGRTVRVQDYFFLSGGCINQALHVRTEAGDFFVKWNETLDESFFAAEAQGLQELHQAGEVRVPAVVGHGRNAQKLYLILEFIPFQRPRVTYWTHLGTALARLHTHTQADFGWARDNFIGALPQPNEPLHDGIAFFVERRLKPQAGRAMYTHLMPRALYDQFEKLYHKLPELLPTEAPALLHGDLWHGNVLVGPDGYACLIDPAVYYGNREAEIAFTYLFGSFEAPFYEAYQAAFPLQPGFAERIEIYNLYPLLVHLNLFGTGYLPGIERVVRKYV